MSGYGWFTIGMMVGVAAATLFIVVLEGLYQTFSKQISAWLEQFGITEDT